MKSYAIIAALAAVTVVSPAIADQSAYRGIAPGISLGLNFGGDARQTPTQFTARFDLRSSWLRIDDTSANVWSAPAISVFDFKATTKGVAAMNVLWHDMLQSSGQLNEDGTSESGSSHNWIWWTGGALVAVGVAALAAGGGHGSDDSSTTGGNPNGGGGGNCVGVTGNIPGDFSVDNSGCPGNVPSVP
jgi:hypothetical protein